MCAWAKCTSPYLTVIWRRFASFNVFLFFFSNDFLFCVLAMSFGFVCLYDVEFLRFSSTSEWLSVRAHVLVGKEKKKENKKGKTSIRLFKKYELKRGLVSDKRFFIPFSCYTIASIVPVSFSQYYILILNLFLSLWIFSVWMTNGSFLLLHFIFFSWSDLEVDLIVIFIISLVYSNSFFLVLLFLSILYAPKLPKKI